MNVTDSNEQTALHLAAFSGHSKCVEMLVRAGAEVNKKDIDGGTALLYGALYGNDTCVEVLLQEAADVNVTNEYINALH